MGNRGAQRSGYKCIANMYTGLKRSSHSARQTPLKSWAET